MGIASRYLEDDDLRIIVWDGPVSGSEWEAFARQQLDDPTWPLGTRRLADITTLDTTRLTSADIETIIALFRERTGSLVGTRQAIVASRGWDLAREYERQIDRLGSATIVFNLLDGACDWLGIDSRSTRQIIAELRRGLRDA